MFHVITKNILLAVVICIATQSAFAQKQIKKSLSEKPEWSQSYQPFRIAGNLYYVGTNDLACYLITTKKGNILINTGLASSDTQLATNIKALGFKLKDTKILLNTQAHHDHLGAMASIKKQTHAKFMINAPDAASALDGGSSDYALGGDSMSFEPIRPDRLLHDGDVIQLGDTKLTMLSHPGHTKGSCSFLLTVKDPVRSWKVLIANMPTIVTDSAFDRIPAYPQITADYTYTIKAMKGLEFDIWVASHASQFELHKKHQPGDAYNPAAFADRKGYDEYLDELHQELNERLRK
ncbi:subclass B3 metallo-beta-lactamase [Ferruginibacter sp. HRS2-29]|uniref:subclass B3 metallo-beta-lactamase n=1 Tax=Ferruginibacter sp. HRS2-29 TaxID=2487334 RepID=UPI0020CD0504|nr:subclass B3 metallo-beta-lactamase [Ferruginibacter sp. HRS2-29]MCP9751367.1 subclass B3 metallo-beta-lactamase [Ferruginibacter sp. HRS2-29]